MHRLGLIFSGERIKRSASCGFGGCYVIGSL